MAFSALDRPYCRKKDAQRGESYIIVERRNGQTTVTRRFVGGGSEVLKEPPKRGKKAKARTISDSNGILGTEQVLNKAKALDAELGVSDGVRYIETIASHNRDGERTAAYKIEFEDRGTRKKWLKAHKRYDADAGYGDPCPGDFRKNTPPEFPT